MRSTAFLRVLSVKLIPAHRCRSNVDLKMFAVVGMAAYFTGVVHAPLTGIVLIIEMTGNYGLILPLFIACFSALLISDGLGNMPIYEALLDDHLRKDRFRRSASRS